MCEQWNGDDIFWKGEGEGKRTYQTADYDCDVDFDGAVGTDELM